MLEERSIKRFTSAARVASSCDLITAAAASLRLLTERRKASAGEFRFDGNRIVRAAKGAFSSGALNETISFDSGFQSCTASIQTGHESGKVYKWKSLDGRNITATSFTPSNPTCSISEGNALAR